MAVTFCYFLVLAILITSVVSTSVNFKNNCGQTINLHKTAHLVGPDLISNINAGGSWSGNFDGGRINFRHGSAGKGITLAEFTFNDGNKLDNYNLSLVDGFNVGMQISPTNPGATVTCRAAPCAEGYNVWSDSHAMKTTPSGGSFTVTFCP